MIHSTDNSERCGSQQGLMKTVHQKWQSTETTNNGQTDDDDDDDDDNLVAKTIWRWYSYQLTDDNYPNRYLDSWLL